MTHDCDECEEVRHSFSSKTWQDLLDDPADPLQFLGDALPLFSESAFEYYLPAYMVWSLRHLHTDNMLADNLVWTLCPTDPYGSADEALNLAKRDRLVRRTSALTLAQKDAVKAFLEFAIASEPSILSEGARLALRRFWS